MHKFCSFHDLFFQTFLQFSFTLLFNYSLKRTQNPSYFTNSRLLNSRNPIPSDYIVKTPVLVIHVWPTFQLIAYNRDKMVNALFKNTKMMKFFTKNSKSCSKCKSNLLSALNKLFTFFF